MIKLKIETEEKKHKDTKASLDLLHIDLDEKLALFSKLSIKNKKLWLEKDDVIENIMRG